jgi:hypothetical protein
MGSPVANAGAAVVGANALGFGGNRSLGDKLSDLLPGRDKKTIDAGIPQAPPAPQKSITELINENTTLDQAAKDELLSIPTANADEQRALYNKFAATIDPNSELGKVLLTRKEAAKARIDRPGLGTQTSFLGAPAQKNQGESFLTSYTKPGTPTSGARK